MASKTKTIKKNSNSSKDSTKHTNDFKNSISSTKEESKIEKKNIKENIKKKDNSDSESKLESEESENESDSEAANESESESEKDSQNESDSEEIPLSDVEELESDVDAIPKQKLTINNKAALELALERFALPILSPTFKPFTTHLSIISSEPISNGIPDVEDELTRELAIYKQGLDAVILAKEEIVNENKKIKKNSNINKGEGKTLFSRPNDYFAEMVKSDEHMDKIHAKLVSEATAKKASQDARKQRELKKFGKQVQVAKLQERAREKRQTLENIKLLRKRKASSSTAFPGLTTEDDFDIALEDVSTDSKKSIKRKAKDAKYGLGGKKKFKKSNDANSSADVSGFNAKKMKKTRRLGKSKRHSNRG